MQDEFILDGVSYLNSYKDKIADEFDHFFAVWIHDKFDKFPVLSYFTDKEGRVIRTLTSDAPNKVMSSLYPKDVEYEEELKKEYKKIAEENGFVVEPEVKASIVQSPFRVSAFELSGDERLIKKLLFSEKIKGLNYFSLSEKINEDIFNFILNHYKKYEEGVFFFPYMNEIHIFMKMPEKVPTEMKSLYIDIARILKSKLIEKYDFIENSYKLPEMGIKDHALCVVKLPTEKILEVDFMEIYNLFLDKIEKQIEIIKALKI
ncbi:MAG: DUF4895 domain-containing protein [Thermotogota bacterium]